MATVYVIQENLRFDVSPASEFGEIKVLLPPGNLPNSTEHVVKLLGEGLRDYKSGDWLLLTGAPHFIAICAILVHKSHPKLRLLRWDNRKFVYTPLEIEV